MSDPTAVRSNCLDASALVKWYVEEPGSAALRQYLQGQANWYTTPFCFFEALGVLKSKFKGRKRPDNISEDEYHKATFNMAAEYSARSKNLPDLDFVNPIVFAQVQVLCRKYPALDLADTFLILSVRDGYYSRLCGDSATVLVTADGDLAKAAEQEGVRVHLVR